MTLNRIIGVFAVTVLTILVILTLGAAAVWHKTSQTYTRVDDIAAHFDKMQATLDEIHRDLAQSSVPAIECIGNQPACVAEIPGKVAALRASSTQKLAQLEERLPDPEKIQVRHLRAQMNDFYNSLESAHSINLWTTLRSGKNRRPPLAVTLQPPQAALAELQQNVEGLSRANLNKQKESIHATAQSYRSYIRAIALTGLILIILASAVGLFRISQLQRVAGREHDRAAKAEQELRTLAQELLNVQEHERRQISRELHDEVGQILTGLRMELGSLGKNGLGIPPEFRERLDHAKSLAEEAVRSIRDMAMLLRPPMLDDMGLEPALRWQARQFSSRLQIPVNLDVQADLNALPDRYVTCLYRIAQEALNNCAKHAGATEIQVRLRDADNGIVLTVEDDGVGFNPQKKRSEGLGLISIEERARELHGHAGISSRENGGTRVEVELPLPTSVVS
jgi:signal transduction histidine kinase